jgi:hypothetical protein
MADSIADLGLRIDSSQVLAGQQALDRLTPAAVRAQQAVENLARSSSTAALAQRDEAVALVQNTQATISKIQAKLKAQGAAYVAADTSRKESLALANIAQLERYEIQLQQQLAQATQTLTRSTDQATQSLRQYASARQQTNELMSQAGAQTLGMVNQNTGVANAPTLAGSALRGQDVAAYSQELDKLRAKFNPVFALSKQYEASLEQIARAEAVGAINANEAAAARETERVSFENSTKAVNELSGAHGHLDAHAMAAFHSVRSATEQFAMGVPITQILAQQIGQASFAISGPRGLKGAVDDVIGIFKRFLTTNVLIGAGLLATAGIVGLFVSKVVTTHKELQAALLGTGRAAGVTEAQLNEQAVSAAAAANIGIGSARQYAEVYAATGKIVGSQIGQLTAMTEDYATTTHQKGAEAAKELASGFSDLSKGVDTLNNKLGFLDATTRRHIQDLEAQGNHEAAVNAAIEAMKPSLADHEQSLTLVGRAWENIKNKATEALDAAAAYLNSGGPGSAQENLARAQAQAGAPVGSVAPRGVFGPDWHVVTQEDHAQAVRDLRLFGQVIKDETKHIGEGAKEQLLKSLSLQAQDISDSLMPGLAGLRDLTNKQQFFHQAMMTGAIQKMPADEQENLIRNNQAVTATLHEQEKATGDVALGTKHYNSEIQDILESMGVEEKAIRAVTGAQKAGIASTKEEANVRKQVIDPAHRQQVIALAGKIAYEQWKKAIDDQNLALAYNRDASLAVARANMENNIPALEMAKAHYHALTEEIGSGLDVQDRELRILETVAAERAQSLSGNLRSQLASNDALRAGLDEVNHGSILYNRLDDAVSAYAKAQEDAQLLALAQSTHNQALIATVEALIAKYPEAMAQEEALNREREITALLHPYDDDIDKLGRLADALTKVNADSKEAVDIRNAMAKIGLHQDLLGMQQTLGQANPFGAGQGMLQNSIVQQAQDQADAWTAAWHAAYDKDAAAAKAHADELIAINQYKDSIISHSAEQTAVAQLQFGVDAFTGLAEGVGNLVGKTSDAYAMIFRIAKGFALAQALISEEIAIAKAMELPWPENIPAISQAIAGFGTILSDIASIVAPTGHAHGVVGISGPGNSTSDSIPSMLSAGESVVTARATRSNRATLHAMNRGAAFDAALAGHRGAGMGLKVEITHDGSTSIQYERVSDSHIRFVARQEIKDLGPQVAAASQAESNGVLAKATRKTIRAGRLRT